MGRLAPERNQYILKNSLAMSFLRPTDFFLHRSSEIYSFINHVLISDMMTPGH